MRTIVNTVNYRYEKKIMKPKNFPARKLARQISAQSRHTVGATQRLHPETDLLDAAREVRTKKARSSVL